MALWAKCEPWAQVVTRVPGSSPASFALLRTQSASPLAPPTPLVLTLSPKYLGILCIYPRGRETVWGRGVPRGSSRLLPAQRGAWGAPSRDLSLTRATAQPGAEPSAPPGAPGDGSPPGDDPPAARGRCQDPGKEAQCGWAAIEENLRRAPWAAVLQGGPRSWCRGDSASAARTGPRRKRERCQQAPGRSSSTGGSSPVSP